MREPPATPHREVLLGTGLDGHVLELPVPALERDVLPGEQELFTASSTSSVRRPRSFIEIPIAVNSGSFQPGPTPKMNRPSDMWSRVAELLGEQHRVAQRYHQDVGSDRNGLGGAGHAAQHHQGVHPRAAVESGSAQEVVPHRDRVVAERFGPFRHVLGDEAGHLLVEAWPSVRGNRESEFHWKFLRVRSCVVTISAGAVIRRRVRASGSGSCSARRRS